MSGKMVISDSHLSCVLSGWVISLASYQVRGHHIYVMSSRLISYASSHFDHVRMAKFICVISGKGYFTGLIAVKVISLVL